MNDDNKTYVLKAHNCYGDSISVNHIIDSRVGRMNEDEMKQLIASFLKVSLSDKVYNDHITNMAKTLLNHHELGGSVAMFKYAFSYEVKETYYFTNLRYGGYADYVHCNNCDSDMIIPCGCNICPMCGSDGTLSWKDEVLQEVEVDSFRHITTDRETIYKLSVEEDLSFD